MKFKLLVLLSWSAAASLSMAGLPNGYEAVDSVTANGAQYVDTGVSAQEGLAADVTFMYTRNVDKCVLGAGAMLLPTPANAAINRKYHVATTFSGPSGADHLYLFARNDGGTAADLAWARVYAVKLSLGETVLRDFVPCRETSTGALGLYDQQNGGFYPSEGDKPFFMPWRAGVYGGLGGTGSVFELYRLVDRSPEVELVNISAEMAQEGSVFDRVDMIVMPGGSSKNEMASLGAAGQANLISFIRNGGTYYGTCAGSHLVLADELNISGYTRDSYYDGSAYVDIAIGAEGMRELGLEKTIWNARYHQGPFIVDGPPVEGADLKVWGIYTNTDIVAASGADNRMEGKYAVLAGSYFDGRMLVIASHPESDAANYPFVRQAWRWLSGRDDITTETKKMGGYVNGRTNVFYVGTYADGIYPIVETMLRVDVDPRMNLVAASELKTAKYQPTARALVADTASKAAPYQRSDYKTAIDAFKLNGGLVLVAEDCASKDELWELVDGIANDRRAETAVAWGEGRALTFEGSRKLKGLDLRLPTAEDYSTTFADGEISFEADENKLGGDWAYCGAGSLHRVIVSNARVSAVYGNHYRDSFYSVTASGGKYTYTPVASNRFEITLGSRNVANGPAVIAFERELVIAKGSTLAIDARGMPAGNYRIFEAGTLSVRESDFTDKAVVTADDGFLYSLAQEGDAIVLKLADGSELYKVDYVESTGRQYIDTGIELQDKVALDIDFEWTSNSGGDTTSYAGMFAVSHTADDGNAYKCYLAYTSTKKTWRCSLGTGEMLSLKGFSNVGAGNRYRLAVAVDGTNVTQSVNGSAAYTTTFADTLPLATYPRTFYLGAVNLDGRAGSRWPSRIYSAKVYTNLTVLARDYRPCYQAATGTYGLFDAVTKTFFPSAEGAFAGAAVPDDPKPVDPDAWKKLYQPVEYVQSTGSQFVNTGLTVQNKIKLDIDWMWTGPFLNYSVLLGASITEGDVSYRQYLGYATTTGDWRAITENSKTTAAAAAVAELGKPVQDMRQHLVQSVNGKVVSFNLDGVEASKTCSNAQTAHQAPLYLFGHRTTDDALAGATSMRLYAAKVYTNLTVLARDYVPCREKATGRFGLYDHVTETFHPSDSAEDFFGPEEAKGIAFVDYIESTGKQFVDTGINMQDQLTLDIAYTWTAWPSSYATMFGGYVELDGTTYRNYITYVNTSRKWRGAIESNGLVDYFSSSKLNERYRVVATVDGTNLTQQSGSSTITKGFAAAQTTHPHTDYLFALHYNDGYSSASLAKLYEARIYTNSVAVGERVLARDYRPAFLRATKTYGLYDVVSGEFFPSGSDTPFTGPPPKLPGLILLFR